MKKILILAFISIALWNLPCFAESKYSVSQIIKILDANPRLIENKEIHLSSCGVSVLECSCEERQNFVFHMDDPQTYSETTKHSESRKNRILIYGTEKDRKAGKLIGYKKCGTYKGKIIKNPYQKYQKKHKYIFEASKIVEEHERNIIR